MRRNTSSLIRTQKNERGAILFVVAAGLIAFLGIAGLAFDLGVLYNVKTDLQNAMDAAALAGASQLNGTSAGINNAVTKAQNAANNFRFNNLPVNLQAGSVQFSTQRDTGYMDAASASGVASTIKFVKASSQKTIELAIIKIVPGVGASRDVAANAVSGQSPPLNVICDGIIPLAPAPQGGSGEMAHYTAGVPYILRLAGGNDVGSVGPGNYLILDFSPVIGGNSGGATVRDLLSGNLKGCFPLGQPICTKTGVTQGPVRQGINERFNSDTNTTEYPGSEPNAFALYTAGNGNGKRVVGIPFVSTQPNVWAPFDNGKQCPVYIITTACFFIRTRVPNGNVDVYGEFVGPGGCRVQGYFDPNATPPPDIGLPSLTTLVLYR